MDTDLTPDQHLLQETTRKFLEKESPVPRVRELFDDPIGFDRDLWRRSADLGWFSMLVPEAYGGTNGSAAGLAGLADLAIVAEELGRLVQPGPFLPTNVVAAAIAVLGSDEQRSELLPPLVAGEATASWAHTEADGRFEGDMIRTTARDAGSDYLLSGTKAFVQDAHAVDHLLVSARLDGGLAQFLVPTAAEGVTVHAMEALDLARRHSMVELDDVRLPASARLGEPGTADAALERQLDVALTLQVAESVGLTDRAFEFTLEYTKDRVAFGRPIGSFQAIKHRLADAVSWLEAMKAIASTATRAVASGADDASQQVSIAKAWVGERSSAICGECLQFHGGIGYTWDHDIHLYLRRAKSNESLYGTPAWHRERLCQLAGV